MRIMLDTNILVSMIFFPSVATKKLAEQLSFYHRIILCDSVIEELRLVTERKFPAKIDSLNQFFIELPFEMVYTPRKLNLQDLNIMRDIKDSPILATALMENIDVFITGDKDFHVLDIEEPEILTITDFLEKYSR